jgi:hypothetical protein
VYYRRVKTNKTEHGRKKRKLIVFAVIASLIFVWLAYDFITTRPGYVLRKAIVDSGYYLDGIKIVSHKQEIGRDYRMYIEAKIRPEKAKEMVGGAILKTCADPTRTCADPVWGKSGYYNDEGEFVASVSNDECITIGPYKSFYETLCVNTETGELTYLYATY